MLFELDDFYVQAASVTSEEEALLAVGLGASAVSFDFFHSPHEVSAREAFAIVHRIPPGVLKIGTFRQEAPLRICEIVENLGLDGVELLGLYSDTELSQMSRVVRTIIKGFNPATVADISQASPYVDYFLLSEVDEYDDLVQCWQYLPDDTPKQRLILAGLTADTVVGVVETTPVAGIRVGNGALNERGEKDLALLGHFIADARWAHQRIGES